MLVDPAQTSYAINKYFYPKPLRVGKKVHNEQKIDVYNLESEIRKQFDMNDNLQVNHTSSQGLKGQSAIRMINYKCFK